MQAQAILEVLIARGARFTVRGETLNVAPKSVLDDLLCQAIRKHKRELLILLEAASAPEPRASTCTWPPEVSAGTLYDPEAARVREVLRPEIRQPLALAPLEQDPPEVPPHPECLWVRDLGIWERRQGIVVTTATRSNWRRYHAAKVAALGATSAQPRRR